uniref:CASP8-associated protein 2 n=1 Tax=Oncorhynchus kisutch TaxID=8019 RepID=A0A8C7DHD9_ONCKI
QNLKYMDLYEEIITEEQQDRESSYNELVLPLTCLTCVFTLKNTTLNTENSRLKKNICALIKTAKMEVVRKDEEINRLSQSQLLCKDRDVVHPLLPPTPSDATVFRPPLPDTTVLRPPLLDATVLRPPLLDATVLRPPLPVTSKTAKGDSEAPVKRTVGSSSQDSVNRHPTRELHPSDEPKQTKHREGGGGNPRLSHSNDQRKYNSKSSRCPRLSDVEVRRRSERAKNPTSDILHCTASSDRTSEGLSKDCAAYQSMGSSRHYQELRRDKGDGNRHSRGTKDISSNRKHAYLNQASVTERSSESFNRKGGTSPPRDHRRKEERRREDEVRKEKNTSKKSGERKSTCTERRRAKESDRCSTDVSKDKTMDDSKVGGQKTGEKSEFLPSEAKVAAKSSVEETGPNRKLSFMETLNLTLSPVKKPRRLAETKEQEGTPPEEVPEDQSAEDSGQPDLDNLLILDEINSSVVETDEVFEDPVVQPSSEIPMSSGPGSIDLRHTDKEPCQDANKGLTEATVAKKQPKCQLEVEDIIVQGVSEGKPELPEATVDQRTEPTTPEPPREVCVSAPVCAIVLRTTLKNRPEDCASANKVSDSEDFTAAAVTATTVAGNCGNNSNTDTGLSSNGFTPDHSMENVVLITDNWVCKPNGKTPSALVCESQTVTQVPPAAVCVGHPAVEGVSGKEPSESLQLPLPASVISTSSLDVTAEVQDISKHGVSSTISMEVIPEICITSEIVEDATEIPLECEKERTVVVQGSPLSGFEVSKVSSTTGEVAPSAQHNSGLSQTPKKSLDSEPSHTENEDVNVEPSSSIPLAHDEDSMMLTLGSLKGIPDAISPLTSPVRPMRKSHQPPCHSKPAYVKSLRKEFTSAAGDPNPKKLDVNMENKNPGRSIASATQQDVDRASVCSSSPEDELEEGEILSEGEETPITPSSPAKTVRPTSTVKSQQIPKSSPRLSKKLPEEKGISKLLSKTLTSPVGSPMSKARYKTVQPPLPKAALCTVEEVMAMFVKIRYACRKKYMKLRSTFSKERFCGVMDMSLDSFTDFVDSVSFTKLCSQEDDLKVKLKNNIMSVLSKLSNNGIVNRIFDQEPLNMKSKLWEFVNVQLDFLFKEIQTALRSVCKSSNGNQSAGAEKRDLSLSKQPVKSPKPPVKSPKGKNIKMSFEEDKESEPQTSDHPLMQPPMQPPLQHGLEILSSNSPSSAEKTAAYVRRLSQNGSLHDKSDFEILTEQQASNLTFNLVTDSQMGEIFKCLLQGSDLLETSVSAGDNQGWPLGTPRKGERFRGVTTPSKVGTTTKVGTPSKVIATWSSISPCKFSSPNSKVQIPLNPALLDESCMLEVPSSLPEDKMTSQSSVFSQRSYSILAEDLAVSLTIPSPLKSDNHLSFLHPANVEPTSAPDSVISAHFSEDALMDGEDATEQDIHLALDTDNSSGGSSGAGRTREAPVNPLFHFKPHLPMQAVVMEKSNDHFIVRIRHANTSPDINSNNSGVNFTNLGINFSNLGNNSTSLVVNPTCLGIKSTSQGVNSSSPGSVNSTYPGNNSTNPDTNSSYPCVNSTSPQVNCTNPGIYPISADINPRAVSSPQTPPGGEQHGKDQAHPTGKTPSKTHFSEASPPFYLSTSTETASALSSPCLTIIEDTPERDHSKGKTGKKRTRHHVEMKAKRPKKEVIPEKIIKHKKKSSKRAKGKETRSSKSERSKVTTPPQSTPSPNSLSAKNIIIKKGAVVVTWTRDEDRDILLALKMKGASPDTFSSLSEKMNKTPAQIAERFSQLMKLFKKKKMAS